MDRPPLRIACLVGQFPLPSETFVLNQITGLLDRGHTVEIFAREPGGSSMVHAAVAQYDLPSRTYYRGMPASRLRRLPAAARLVAGPLAGHPRQLLGALNPLRHGSQALSLSQLFWHGLLAGQGPFDVVHCHFGPMGRLGARLRQAGVLRGPLLTSFYGYDLTHILRTDGPAYYRHLFQHGDRMLPVSQLFRRRLIDAGCPQQKIRVHHLGVRCSRLALRHWQLWPSQKVRLLTIARLVEKKGVEYAIRAVARVAEQLPDLRIDYQIIGDGPLRGPLVDLIGQLDAGRMITLAGWKTHEETLLEITRSDLLLAPSVTAADGDEEGTPVVLMEAMATGLPVLSTWHSGIPEVVRDGQSGALVPQRDAEALAGRLKGLLEQRSSWPEMGLRGRRMIEEQFDLDRLNDQLVELYHRLASGDSPAA